MHYMNMHEDFTGFHYDFGSTSSVTESVRSSLQIQDLSKSTDAESKFQ